jgi:hypothetical protein
MQQRITLFRVFIASPSDLADERGALKDIVSNINGIFARETDLRIELLGWEDTMPGGGRPQELINIDVDKADLFVGCLWRRWGTPAGPDGRTGFEEEFERALDRRTKTAEPSIWLFFKEIPEEERKDPGTQLKKVLAFREREEKAKRLLFQQFTDVEDWRYRITPLLHRRLLQLMRRSLEQKEAEAPQSQQASVSTPAALSPGAQPIKSVSVASIASLLRAAGDELSAKSLAEFQHSGWFDDAHCMRLLLFAASLYSQKMEPIEFGTHESNSAYLHRQKLKLTPQERLFLIKTTLSDYSVTKPGWYWATRWKTKMSVWLPWLVRFDRDEDTRVCALHFATEIGFPLDSVSSGRAVYLALTDSNLAVRLGALAFLAKHGTTAALSELRQFSSAAANAELKDEATNTESAIRVRLNPEKEIKHILSDPFPFSQKVLSAIRENIVRLTSGTLQECLNHSSPVLRASAAGELIERASLKLPSALQLVTDDSRAVREKGFYALIDHGASPPPTEIRSQLSGYRLHPFSFSEETINPDEVIRHYFGKQSAEKLWNYVEIVDENSPIALRVLGERFPSQRKTLRDALADDFAQPVSAAKIRRDQGSLLGSYVPLLGEDPIEAVRSRLRIAALATLADRPEPDDKEVFQKFLSSELSAVDQTIACLRGLSGIGSKEDIAGIKPFLSSASVSVKAATARTHLLLAPDRQAAIQDLAVLRSEHIIWVIVALELKRRDIATWKQLRVLLTDTKDEIRRLICYYAVSVLERRELTAVLGEYPKTGRYYYNVVTLLDRALYAPLSARTYFRQQEIQHFAKLTVEATHGWPGLKL